MRSTCQQTHNVRVAVRIAQVATAPKGPWQRIADGVCRRAFSSPEAFAYESTIAPALASVVVPVLLPHICGGCILDVGCGGGRVDQRVAAARPVTIVGVDPSTSQVRRLARGSRRMSTIAAIQARAESLPFGDATFDAVISSCAWKHWPSAELGIAECVRVLRPGGTLTVVEVDGSTTPEAFWQFAQKSRIPFGMWRAYVRFAMRTVVGVAPDSFALEESFRAASVGRPTIERIGDMPFLVATLTLAAAT